MTTPRTASNSEARKRLAEQNGTHTKHWDPAVVQLIEQARAEGAAEVVARVEVLADELLAFDCLDDMVPSDVDVPDDFEHGVHDSGRRLRAAIRGGAA